MSEASLKTEYLSTASLLLNPRNARTHSKKQVKQIAASMRRFGFTSPILIDGGNMVLAGHGRLEAAKHLGMEMVPCVRLAWLTPEQKRAYVIADNALALNAEWDEEVLGAEFQAILVEDPTFDFEAIGFSVAEADGFIEGLAPDQPGNPVEDRLPPAPEGRAVSQPGELWQLAWHRLFCGDARESDAFQKLLDGDRAQMVFTDPPYNVVIAGNVSGLGEIQHREFAMASGEMTFDQFVAFLQTIFLNITVSCVNGAIVFVCMDWRHIGEMAVAGKSFTELKNLVVWDKGTAGMGTFYRSRHELVFAFKSGDAPHINTFELGQHGRHRSNLWPYRGLSGFKAGRMEELNLHPTVKPVAMIADAIKDVSTRGGIVLDPFGGSGSTLIAAHKTGRRGYLIELDPLYVDRTIRRWQTFAHDDAVLATTGQTFTEVEKIRSEGGNHEKR